MVEEQKEELPKRSFVRVKVRASLDGAGGKKTGFLYIDRKTGEMFVRTGGKRYAASFTVSEVADFIAKNACFAEQGIKQRFAPKKARRRGS